MPTYEYVCQKCAKKFDVLVRTSRQKIECPKCRGRNVKKAVSVFGMKTGADMPPRSGGG
jgi:putative FmdB family regulatory protein